MRRSIPFLFIIALVLIIPNQSFGQSESVSKNSQATVPANARTVAPEKKVTIDKVEQDLAEALALIEEQHIEGDDVEYNDLFKSMINSMLHGLDPHSNYYDAKEFREFQTNQNSRYYGIGATIGDLRDKDGKVDATYIKATFKGAPANRAGLRFGDRIVEVNGKSVVGKPYPFVREMLRGPKGTIANLVVEGNLDGKRRKVEIVRDAVSTPSIPEAYMMTDKVGYIAMTRGFNRTTHQEFVAALKDLKQAGMERLVIDLRNNRGGLVNQAFWIAETFLGKEQAIFTQKGRSQGPPRTYSSGNTTPDKTPLVVMINRSSASASEILAGALQDHDRALIVGENSFGKGLVQNPFPLEYGSMLLLTIAKYETPSGRLIQKDYSHGSLYNYETNGGSLEGDEKPKKNKGPESKTDSGRTVFGGNGITPDFELKPMRILTSRARYQQTLNDPIFKYVLISTAGKNKKFPNLKVEGPIQFGYDLNTEDFQITDQLYQDFLKFAVSKFGVDKKKLEAEKEYVIRALRTEMVTAAYGTETSFQVFNDYDTQLQKAVTLFPEAEKLASNGDRARKMAGKR